MEESYEFMKILSIDEAKTIAQDKKVVIVTGVTGQDGSFMADYLLKTTPYEIFGGARRLSVSNHENVDHLRNEPRFHLINFDLTDAHSIAQIISQLKPAYFINFAAQSFVKSSWDFPAQTWDTNSTSIIHILESIRLHCPSCRFYNAGSSEEFGAIEYSPQDEKHPLRPQSPYGASKAAARQLVRVYRESYNLYAVQGWLFNHEGTRRGDEFVTRKITKNVARIVGELRMKGGDVPSWDITPLELGNLSAKRDWTDAEDCVQAVWRMLNQEQYDIALQKKVLAGADGIPIIDPSMAKTSVWTGFLKEYVVGSGYNHTIREFVEKSFDYAGVVGEWKGTAENETYVYKRGNFNVSEGTVLVKVNPAHYRPAEVQNLCANPQLITDNLRWKPMTTFEALVRKMTFKDLNVGSAIYVSR